IDGMDRGSQLFIALRIRIGMEQRFERKDLNAKQIRVRTVGRSLNQDFAATQGSRLVTYFQPDRYQDPLAWNCIGSYDKRFQRVNVTAINTVAIRKDRQHSHAVALQIKRCLDRRTLQRIAVDILRNSEPAA